MTLSFNSDLIVDLDAEETLKFLKVNYKQVTTKSGHKYFMVQPKMRTNGKYVTIVDLETQQEELEVCNVFVYHSAILDS